MNTALSISQIINELGEDRELYFNAVAPPIIQTSNFTFKKVSELRKAFEDEMGGYLYSRGINPTVDILRKKLAALDGAEDCLVFNSGAAAIFAAVLANVKTGDHIISVREPYAWAKKMFDVILPRFGVTTTYINGTAINNFEAALQQNTTLIYLESPNSWTYELQPLTAVATLAKQKKIVTVCDNSYCTPLYQKPVELGIDIALQSATKYISGHSDVVAGVISGTYSMMKKIFNSEYLNIGSGIQPFNAWLLIRGLRTLPLRLQRITETTKTVVDYLLQHPAVEQVIFPGHTSFAQHALAQQQMQGACGLVTIIFKTKSMQQVVNYCEKLQHIMMAVSWGGHESLIIPKCAGLPPQQFNSNNPQHRSARLYIGLEDAAYLIADMEQAFV
jgi:cystathionine beta-lyase/cystathionine gamma-synthase